MSITISRMPSPSAIVPGRHCPEFKRATFDNPVTAEDLANMKLGNESKTLPGYWSITTPKFHGRDISSITEVLRLMANSVCPLTCVYIDSADGYARFDLQRRSTRLVRENFSGEFAPEHLEDIDIPWTSNDPDLLIASDNNLARPLTSQELYLSIKKFSGELVRNFAFNNIHGFIKKSRNDLLMSHNCNDDELRARGLLRDMVGDEAYRRYLKCGFITCVGVATKMIYVVRGGYSNVDCYRRLVDGSYRLYESVCIQFKDQQLPFTDGVIMRKLMIENDEFSLRKNGNVRRLQEPVANAG